MSLCLNMIVKNESHIIEQTLENICCYFPLTYWVISDTGSSDDTIAIIENFFENKGINGHIHQEPWRDFSHNRNAALKECVGKGDYILIFDADDEIQGDLSLPELTHDAYYLQMSDEDQSIKYYRRLIIKNNGNYQWKGVLHEFLDYKNEHTTSEILGDYTIISGRKGSRSLNENKYRDDAETLEKAYFSTDEPDLLPRYAFYCAQSYRDAEMIDKSIEWYEKRIALSEGWVDEKYCSYEKLGLLFERKNNYKEALYSWQQGIALDPMRAECWYHSARRHSWSGNTELAYCFAKQASELSVPTGNRLFINKHIYDYWSTYEWCLNAYKMGKTEESYHAFKKLISHCPEDLVNRLSKQMIDYRTFILEDSFYEIRVLSINLNRLNQIYLLDKALSN